MAHRFGGNGYLSNVIGNPLETTIALSHMIFEGTFDRFPNLRICGPHGGGYLPHYFGRRTPGSGPGGSDPMVDMFVADIEVGIADTSVKAAMLKCAVDAQGLTPGVERVLRTVSEAHRRTGAPITVHTHAPSRGGLEVQRVLREEGVSFQRIKTWKVSNDPDFETKAADVIGLYLDPPAHAAVFCVDEKTAIQALDRKDRMLPLSPGRAESHGFEYKRNGTLSLFAALNTGTGEVLGKTAPRHTSEQFVTFLQDIVASQSSRREIHVICDNVSSHKTPLVQAFLLKHRRVHMHYTPTYSSWLNQVENWFARIQRDVIARGVFTSIKDLDKKLMWYIRQYNKDPKRLKWTYADPSRRITSDSSDSVD
jgi:transposase